MDILEPRQLRALKLSGGLSASVVEHWHRCPHGSRNEDFVS
jgi:hypothetical protein